MAVGPDQMADLDSIQAPINERSPSSAAGDDLLHPGAPARFAMQSGELSPSTVPVTFLPVAPNAFGVRRSNTKTVEAAVSAALVIFPRAISGDV